MRSTENYLKAANFASWLMFSWVGELLLEWVSTTVNNIWLKEVHSVANKYLGQSLDKT